MNQRLCAYRVAGLVAVLTFAGWLAAGPVVDQGAAPWMRFERLASAVAAPSAAALLPMRRNADALSDLVVLEQGATEPVVLASAPRATFTVTSTGNESDANTSDGVCSTSLGTCTLRAALQQANASAGADVIHFSIGGSVPIDRTIALTIPLPTVTEAVTVDGSTSAWSAATL